MTKLVTTAALPYVISLGPQAHSLDQGLLAISVETPITMEIKCEDHSHIKTLEPPIQLSSTCNQCAVHSPHY